jgi:hypothetical protein
MNKCYYHVKLYHYMNYIMMVLMLASTWPSPPKAGAPLLSKGRIAKCQKSPTVRVKETYQHAGLLTYLLMSKARIADHTPLAGLGVSFVGGALVGSLTISGDTRW